MSFSFRNLFSQDSEEESQQQPPPGGFPNQPSGNQGQGSDQGQPGTFNPPPGPGVQGNPAADPFAGRPQAQGQSPGQGQPGFTPTPQPTDRGTFEAMFSNQGTTAPGEGGPGDRSAFGPPAGPGPQGSLQTFTLQEIKPFIPPALAAQGDFPMDRSVSVEMPEDGSTDVKLSAIYASCPELFATEITPLNDSIVTLPSDDASSPAPNPFSSALTAQAQQSFSAAREEAGALPAFEPKMPGPAATDPFSSPAANVPVESSQSEAESSFSPPPSFSLPAGAGHESESPANNPFGSMPSNVPPPGEAESIPTEVLPAETEAFSPIQDPVAAPPENASAFGFPPPRDEAGNDDAATPFGPFGNPPVPAADAGGEDPSAPAAAAAFGFPPSEPSSPPFEPTAPPAEGFNEASPAESGPSQSSPEEAPGNSSQNAGFGSETAQNRFESKPVAEPFANPFDSTPPDAASPIEPPGFEGAGEANDAGQGSNPFAALPPMGGGGENPKETEAPAPAAEGETGQDPNPFASLPPVGGPGENVAESEANPENAPGANPFASFPSSGGFGDSPGETETEATPTPTPFGEMKAGVEPRSVSFHLRNLLGGAPETGIDPMQLPVEAMIKLPVSLIEPQLASGSVTLPLGEVMKFADPAIVPILQAGNPEAPVSLPDNDLFHQISDLAPMPPPPARKPAAAEPEAETEAQAPEPQPQPQPESQSQSSWSPFGGDQENPFATPFSEQAHQDEEAAAPPADGFSLPVVPADDFGPGLGESGAPTDFASQNSFGQPPVTPEADQTPDTPAAEENVEPPSRFSQVNPFAPLERSGDRQTPPDEEPGSFLDPPETATRMPPEDASGPGGFASPNAAPPADEKEEEEKTRLPSFDALIPQGGDAGAGVGTAPGTSFFDELEASAQREEAFVEPAAKEEAPAGSHHLPPVDDEIVSDVELRAVFGTSETFDAQKVADLSSELAGVAACVITGPRGVFQGHKGADPQFAEKAAKLVKSARDFADATGVPNAESFTIHTDQGAISIFISGEDRCLAVRHEPGGFDPGVREKLILVARGLAGLS